MDCSSIALLLIFSLTGIFQIAVFAPVHNDKGSGESSNVTKSAANSLETQLPPQATETGTKINSIIKAAAKNVPPPPPADNGERVAAKAAESVDGRQPKEPQSKLSANRFNVATLNCGFLPLPWPIGSKHNDFRLQKLIAELTNSQFDVIALQEVWSDSIFVQIAHELNSIFPHSHYFHSGFTGSGTCVFSKHLIISTLLHKYSLNGFPHHVHRGDWYGGKIVGMVELMVKQYRVAFYTTHLHAEYNRENDPYLPHRISQCFEMAQFIRHTSQGSDFVVVAGDFNVEPNDLGYHLIKDIAQLFDAWEIRSNLIHLPQEDGMTCERPDNSYTCKSALQECPNGKRLDYIMYRSGKTDLCLVDCANCFNKIPGSALNFSDHIGVSATFSFGHDEKLSDSHSEQMRPIVIEKEVLTKALKIIEEGEARVLWDRRLFLGICVALIPLTVATFNLKGVALFRLMLILFIIFSFLHGFIGLTIEMKALKETKYSIKNFLRSL